MNYTINLLILLWIYYVNISSVNTYILNIIDKNPSFKNRLIKYLWYYMKCKTIIEKKYNLISKEINKIYYLIDILLFEKKEEPNILIIKEGDIVDKSSYMYIKNYDSISDYNMVLYEWELPENDKYDNYVLRFSNINEVNDKFKTSKVSLLAVELCMKTDDCDELYAIDFKKNNYYIVNNILFDKDFLKYWCNNILKIELSDNYEISFFDNNMEHHTLKQNQSIKILQDDFEII
tara:strand:- start:205 stop:906 length:702 start_codon:yes stop_codon:yes gene_type:complete